MTKNYFGCEDAASATAKIVFTYDSVAVPKVFYFGDEEAAIDFLNDQKKTTDTKWDYEFFSRDALTGKGWFLMETGSNKAIRWWIGC